MRVLKAYDAFCLLWQLVVLFLYAGWFHLSLLDFMGISPNSTGVHEMIGLVACFIVFEAPVLPWVICYAYKLWRDW